MSLIGLTKEQLERELKSKSHADLVGLIYHLVSFPPMVSPSELARRRDLDVRTVFKLIKDGRLGAHKLGKSVVRIPVESVNELDERTRV
jgi:excisionase family DNA binding protein